MDQCFKIHGFPDWYKGDKGKQNVIVAAQATREVSENVQDSPLTSEDGHKADAVLDGTIMQAVFQEVMKAFKGKGIFSPDTRNMSNFAGKVLPDTVATNVVSLRESLGSHGWIIDTGASAPHIELFITKRTLSEPVMVGLPDDSLKEVKVVGDI